MYIRWHGYSCFEFADDRNRVVFDPHDGKSIGVFAPTASARIVLCTHNSFDRNAFRVIKGNHKDVVCEFGVNVVNGFEFEGLPTFGDEKGGTLRGPNAIYTFRMDGISFAFCGCLGAMPADWVIDRLKGVDVIFVPVGERYTLCMEKVNEFLRRVGAKVVVPTDFRIGGITLPLSSIDDFMEGKDPADFIHVGNEIDLIADDITDFTGYWIFDR
ncbi:MAG: MBL fold metallo-hydrolase [archaeon]|nr:MBL fold metallo-hydrolase [archaeon]